MNNKSWLIFVAALSACPASMSEDAGAMDAGVTDAGVTDAGVTDAGVTDAGVTDAGVIDAGVIDAGAIDAGAIDAGVIDAGVIDAGVIDAGLIDAGVIDAGVIDAGVIDAGVIDAGVIDAGAPGLGRIEGTVTEALSHVAIAGAVVEAGGRTTTTSATGEFVLTQVPDGVPLQLRVRGPQGSLHSTTQREVVAPATGALFITTELLAGCTVTLNLANDAGVFVPRGCGANDARVGLQLPASGVVDAQGAVVNDVRVELAVLPVALGGRVASDALAAFPGDMQALTTTGAAVYLESRGAVEVRLSSATTGAPLQLAPGRTAVVTFSASAASFDDEGAPAWFFDEAQGRWVEEGHTTLVADPVTGAMLHRLEVSHFTFWNADQPATRTCVTGRLVEPDGGVLAGAQASTFGLDYVGQSSVSAAANGRFSVFARRSSEVELVGGARVGTGVAQRRLRVRTNPDMTCVDVGDVAVDTAPFRGCVSGRALDRLGNPIAGLDVVAHTWSDTGRTVTAANGTFCAPVLAGERLELLLSGLHQGLPVVRRLSAAVVPGGGQCGGTGCLAVGDVTLNGFACVAGRVLNGAGGVSGAQVRALGVSGLQFARSGATGDYCLPLEQDAEVDLFAVSSVPQGFASEPAFGAPSTVASCGGACALRDLVLTDAACVRGVVTDNGTPVEGVRVDVTPVGGGGARVVFSGAGGAFCAPMTAGTSADLAFSMARPGTRYFATAQVSAPTGPASCGGSGCADAGVVALTSQSFSGCVKGRLSDGPRPFRAAVDVRNGNRVALLRPREDGSFCVEVPVATTLSLVDPTPRAGCARLRTVPVDVTQLQAGSCADESRCLEAGELDFADFCASS